MTKHPRRFLSLVLALAVGACSLPFLGVPALDGRQVYERSCASCHGREGRGDGPVAKSLTRRPTDLTRLDEGGGGFPERRVADAMTGRNVIDAHGTREMPVWSDRFAPSASGATAAASVEARRQVVAVTEYLRSIQRSSRPPDR